MPLTSCQAKSITPIDPALGQAFDAAIMVAPPTVAIVPSVLAPPPHRTTSTSTHFCAIETWRSNGISIKTQTPNIFRRDIYTNPAQATFSLSLSLFWLFVVRFWFRPLPRVGYKLQLEVEPKSSLRKTHTYYRNVNGTWCAFAFWVAKMLFLINYGFLSTRNRFVSQVRPAGQHLTCHTHLHMCMCICMCIRVFAGPQEW